MTNDKIEVVVLGGSGLIGRSIIKDYLSQNIKVLNLDLVDNLDRNKFYFFRLFMFVFF